jgi:hypothetical protein
LITKWFGQKLDSSSLHCLHCHGYIAMAGDENYWDFSIGLGQLGLKLQPTYTRQSNVENQARRSARTLVSQEL